jgi:hypothetical protein
MTALHSAISTKNLELAAEFIEDLEAKLSEAQSYAYVKLNELDHVKSIRCTNHQLIPYFGGNGTTFLEVLIG